VPTHPKELLRISVVYLPVDQIKPDPRNARKHPAPQMAPLMASISEFGFVSPVIIDEHDQLIAGHARLESGKAVGLKTIPCVVMKHLSAAQKRALALADNRIAELAIWDTDMLRETLEELINVDFNVETTGFSTAEIDVLFEAPSASPTPASDPDDEQMEVSAGPAVTIPGDLWLLGKHRVTCGNSLEEATYERLLEGERADLVCEDMPFNVKISGHVSGLGKVKHREFAMASGEMSQDEYTEFLTTAFGLGAKHSVDGSIHFQFTDWRHLREMVTAGYAVFTELKGVCVWDKRAGGMGSMWRSQHELIFAWKHGRAPHVNNVQLGKNGRYRTNIWSHPGLNSFRKGRDEELAMHPTVKPVGLIADAIRDCSRIGGLVLDAFGGSGTTLIAAERTRRRAALIEIDPHYVDIAIRRWEKLTGHEARLASTGQTFAEVEAQRHSAAVAPSSEEPGND
jgi:hypothetical protein